ncbi:cytochrome c family protein [Lentisphaera araneosa HTCC2155]|uniref:Cytochrome c family protein n=1 Tax=Lentisphaera araneosa HTCC2155 TaxID=313628 RepID=A6DMR9_9BACT|nr:c-type cytochrome [Lentisphaera araneosa]EDM26955.1 cytochrome c family protein [Lentisphaera araneosa HTCC2155]
MILSIIPTGFILISLSLLLSCKAGEKSTEQTPVLKEKKVAEADKLEDKAQLLPADHPFAQCATCHGVNGEGNQELFSPRISGQNSAYINQQIESYKMGWRGKDPKNPHGLIMAEVAKKLSKEDLEKINKYLKTVKAEEKSPRLYANTIRGERLYRTNGCSYCHGDNAEGDPVNKVPRLNHQHGWYMLKQLKNFKSGVRGAHADDAMGHTMAFYAKTIHDEQSMHDIISWITSISKKK